MFGGIPNSPSFRTQLKIQCRQAHGPDLGAKGRLRGKKEGCFFKKSRGGSEKLGPCGDTGGGGGGPAEGNRNDSLNNNALGEWKSALL